jgi:diaminopimelate epimerase
VQDFAVPDNADNNNVDESTSIPARIVELGEGKTASAGSGAAPARLCVVCRTKKRAFGAGVENASLCSRKCFVDWSITKVKVKVEN